MEGRSVPMEMKPPERPALRYTHPHKKKAIPGGKVGANSSFSLLPLRGFHRRALVGKGASVRGERVVVVGDGSSGGGGREPLLWHSGKP